MVLGDQVERHSVQRAGHDPKDGAESQRGTQAGEQADEPRAQAEHEVAHEVEPLQANKGREEALHIWGENSVSQSGAGRISDFQKYKPVSKKRRKKKL